MRKFLWIILLTWCVFQGCAKDDITVFEVAMPHEGLSFKAITGGAIMYYHLPEGKDVMSIRVRYQDALGQKMIRTGSYACDSLVLPGFNEARQGVPAKPPQLSGRLILCPTHVAASRANARIISIRLPMT